MTGAHRVLVLGGAAEARDLAAILADDPRFDAQTSLAGRTRNPAPVAGRVRVGGFGGAAGLAEHIRTYGVLSVIDATHPFAVRISANAEAACAATNVARLTLLRPPWTPRPGDAWNHVADAAAAARAIRESGARRPFLAVGRQSLDAYADLAPARLLVRLVDPPEPPPPLLGADYEIGAGPFAVDAETSLLAARGVDLVVVKNSGGAGAYAKIAAARALGLPVIMIRRPPPPPQAQRVETVADALRWLEARLLDVSGDRCAC